MFALGKEFKGFAGRDIRCYFAKWKVKKIKINVI